MAEAEPMKAWIIEDMSIIDPQRNRVVIGTEADAEESAKPLGDNAWVSGPYEFTIALKP